MTVQNNQVGLEVHPTAPPAETPGAAYAGEVQFQFLANALPQIVWTAQPDGRMDYFNQRWFEYTDLTLEQSKNLGWHLLIHPADLQGYLDSWEEALHSGTEFRFEFRLKRKSDASYRWQAAWSIPIRNPVDGTINWLGTYSDIHDHRLAEQKLQHSRER